MNARVLVVDDDPTIAEVVGDYLREAGLESRHAADGPSGLSLAGAMECGFCALAMREGFVPGSAHLTRVDPACEGLNIPRTTQAAAPEIVLKNSSGFGGANVAILFRRV